MEEKIFQARSMLEALEKVRDEMGPDALVISVREIQAPAWSPQKKSLFEIKAAPAWSPQKKSLFEIKAAPAGTEPNPQSPHDSGPKPSGGSAGRFQTPKPASDQPRPATDILLQDDASAVEWLVDEKPAGTNAPRRPVLSSLPPAPDRLPGSNFPHSLSAPVDPLLNREKTQTGAVSPLAPEMPASLQKLEKSLLAQDLDPVFLKRLMGLAFESMSPQNLKSEELVKKHLARQFEAELRIASSHDLKPPAPVVCLVGTSGSGKTSMAARMAIHYGSRLMKKVVWISTDVIRAGAIAEARTYTDALGIPLMVAYSPADLKQALSDSSGADLTLIDLPGYNPLVEAQMEELGSYLNEIPRRSLLLVVSASQKEKDIFQAAASYGIFDLNGLVITKMDETLSMGSVYNLAQKSQIPLVFFSRGRGTTGSFQSASAEQLVSALFNPGGF